MSKNLVAFFSASGVTAKVARSVAEVTGADLFEIVPAELYTAADLDWTNKQSRSTIEMQDMNSRPAISAKAENIAQYDTVYVGFPVWWGREPSIIDTFLDENDLSGKTVVPFCTSGGGGVEGAVKHMSELLASKATVAEGKRIAADASVEEIKTVIC